MNGLQGRLAAIVALQFVALGIVLGVFSTAPPLDVVEGLAWSQHWLIGTYKHPPMPSWFLALFQYIVPGPILGPFLLAQVTMAVTYWLAYRIARLFFSVPNAVAATLLLPASYYMTAPTIQFNHNVLQMPFWAATILLGAQLRRHPENTGLWIAIGVIAGAGLYVKYSFAILLLVLLILLFTDPALRPSLRTRRPWLSVAIASLIFLPHVVWVFHADFAPLRYAMGRSEEIATLLPPPLRPLAFLGEQVTANLGILGLLGIALGIRPRRDAALNLEPDDKRFIRIVTFAPAVLTAALFIFLGAGIKEAWGAPMFTTIGLWVVAELHHEWTSAETGRLFWSAAAVIVFVSIGVTLDLRYLLTGDLPRRMWPMAEITQQADLVWRSHTSQPLRIVGGNSWVAGLVSAAHPRRPYLLIDNSFAESPWLSAGDLAEEGGLFLSLSDKVDDVPCPVAGAPQRLAITDRKIPGIYASVCLPRP